MNGNPQPRKKVQEEVQKEKVTPNRKDWIELIAIIIAACLVAWATSVTCAHFLTPSACRAIFL